jgi:acetoin utilization protein AcuB
MLIKHFMTREVFTLSPERTCQTALREMKQRRIRRAPVLDRKRLVGIVTERDLLYVVPGTPSMSSTKAGEAALDIPVRNIMTTRLKTLHPNDHLELAAHLMLKNRIGGVPVLEGDDLKGIITESDIFKALWTILSIKTACRIIFDPLHNANNALLDIVELCQKHRCHVKFFLCYPRLEVGSIYYLGIEGEEIDALTDDLWAASYRVLSVERNGLITSVTRRQGT